MPQEIPVKEFAAHPPSKPRGVRRSNSAVPDAVDEGELSCGNATPGLDCKGSGLPSAHLVEDRPGAHQVRTLEIRSLKKTYQGLRAVDSRIEDRLLASIAKEGQRVPIMVVPKDSGDFEVVDGFRRLRAMERLKQSVIHAVIWPGSVVDALFELRWTKGRSSCAVLEEALLIEALVEGHRLALSDVALRLGRSKTWVHGRLSMLHQLPEAICQMVLQGKLSAYVATKMAVPFARANGKLAEQFCEAVVEHDLTSRQAEAIYQYLTNQSDPQLQAEALKHPQSILSAMEGKPGSDESPQTSNGIEVLERVERWCRHTRSIQFVLRKLLTTGTSEDTLSRLATLWQERSDDVRHVSEQLNNLTTLGSRRVACSPTMNVKPSSL